MKYIKSCLRQCCEGAKCYVVIIVADSNANDPMLLLLDNSDSLSIVDQSSQGPGSAYNTFS